MKGHIPDKYIVNKRPKEYLKQGMVHCGVYTTKAILEAYGKGVHNDPKKYHVSFFNKTTGRTYKDFLRDWKGSWHRRWLVPYACLEILD